jgi:hypothetical protein
MIVFSLFISLPNFAAGLMFVLTGFVDYQRRVFLMHRCSALLVDPLLIADLQASEEQPQLPLLNFSKANNVGLWLELRQIFKDFGLVGNQAHTSTRTHFAAFVARCWSRLMRLRLPLLTSSLNFMFLPHFFLSSPAIFPPRASLLFLLGVHRDGDAHLPLHPAALPAHRGPDGNLPGRLRPGRAHPRAARHARRGKDAQ